MQFSNINYNLYKSFLVVYETKNISRAAEILYISQPAVSHNIKELEKQLNIQLFYKKSNGMSATSEAEILYKYISSAFNSIWKGELTISDMAGLKTGVVKIGIPSYLTVLFLSDIITEFRAKYPNIKIEIVSKPVPDLINMLQTQNIDLVIDSQPISTDRSKLEIKYLKSFAHCFFTTDKFYTEKPLGIENINNLPLIISSQNAEEIKLLKNSVVGLKLNPIIESWTPESMLKLVREGNGVGFCQEEYIKEDLEKGTLKKLDVLFTLPKLDIYSGYIVDTLAFAPKKFVEFLSSKN
ncbi:MAG: LysR family transcriptional regulator [Clostridia bacterium]|nr:LysR family transcriptional regulator [Clostridiales bacterium]MBQ7917351.1 LysR family transcriptional regulator [Clostridia bacterium]MBQ7918295.1 LysR family transcriptional regulator [Clostridia bacterium]